MANLFNLTLFKRDDEIAENATLYVAGERWYVCTVCGHQAPASKMGLINGKPYCYKYGDYEDEIQERSRKRSK